MKEFDASFLTIKAENKKNALLLLASATTGQTILKAVQALSYYGATISGISAVFSAANSVMGIPIKSIIFKRASWFNIYLEKFK